MDHRFTALYEAGQVELRETLLKKIETGVADSAVVDHVDGSNAMTAIRAALDKMVPEDLRAYIEHHQRDDIAASTIRAALNRGSNWIRDYFAHDLTTNQQQLFELRDWALFAVDDPNHPADHSKRNLWPIHLYGTIAAGLDLLPTIERDQDRNTRIEKGIRYTLNSGLSADIRMASAKGAEHYRSMPEHDKHQDGDEE